MEGGDIIDSHSSRKRAHVGIKARRDREARAWTNRDSVLLIFFFISFRDAPLYRASMLLRRRAAAVDAPWFPTNEETTFSVRHDSPPTTRLLLSSCLTAWIGITRTVDARCTRMHAPSCESRPRRAPMRTNNLTPRGGGEPATCLLLVLA